jgi:curli biogenesis system outer membrane secretion channel CsgG
MFFRSLCIFFIAMLALTISPVVAAGGPSVAVLNFSTQGLTGDWYGNFEPGVALSDLLTDQLVNGGKFNVLDRTHLGNVLTEHQLSASGEVSPASAIQAGRLVGAKYLITGNVLQLDKTGASGGAVGGLLGGLAGGVVGGVHSDKVTLKVAVRVIDATSGQIVQSFSDEQTKTATGLSTAGFGGGGFGSYSNSNFTSSTMGHLINDEAAKIASTLDPSKFSTASPAPVLSGRIIKIDGSNVILNIGSTKGVAVGQYFDVNKISHIMDPDTKKMLTSSEPVAKIQITSVSSDTAVGKVISGTPAVLQTVTSE